VTPVFSEHKAENQLHITDQAWDNCFPANLKCWIRGGYEEYYFLGRDVMLCGRISLTFLKIAGEHLPDYIASYPRRQHSILNALWWQHEAHVTPCNKDEPARQALLIQDLYAHCTVKMTPATEHDQVRSASFCHRHRYCVTFSLTGRRTYSINA
jgi:hypothetical protein